MRKGMARQVTSRCPRCPIASMLATSYYTNRLSATEHETHLALLFVHVDATICHSWSPDGCGRMPLSPCGTRSAHIRVTGCCVASLCSARHAYALGPTGWGRDTYRGSGGQCAAAGSSPG